MLVHGIIPSSLRCLSPLPEAITKQVVYVVDVADFPDRGCHIVLDATEVNGRAVEQDVTRTPIAVTGLAHGTDVNQRFLVIEAVDIIDFFRAAEAEVFGEDTGDVGVAGKTAAVDGGEDGLHLLLIVNVFGEDPLVERVPSRTVYKEKSPLLKGLRQPSQKFPASVSRPAVGNRRLQLGDRPANRRVGDDSVALGVEKKCVIVISLHDDLPLHRQVNALAGVGTAVAGQVAQAVDGIHGLMPNVFQHGLKGFQIAVDVAENGFHDNP